MSSTIWPKIIKSHEIDLIPVMIIKQTLLLFTLVIACQVSSLQNIN